MDLHALKYAKTHEWVRPEADTAVIGISDFAVKSLTDLVYIQLPAIGRKLSPGEIFGEVESVKAVSDLYSPVSGEVLESHAKLADDLGILSEDPFGKGWLIKVRITDPTSLDALMDRTEYEKHCEAEAH
jgi:glycine cleavage system H protein